MGFRRMIHTHTTYIHIFIQPRNVLFQPFCVSLRLVAWAKIYEEHTIYEIMHKQLPLSHIFSIHCKVNRSFFVVGTMEEVQYVPHSLNRAEFFVFYFCQSLNRHYRALLWHSGGCEFSTLTCSSTLQKPNGTHIVFFSIGNVTVHIIWTYELYCMYSFHIITKTCTLFFRLNKTKGHQNKYSLLFLQCTLNIFSQHLQVLYETSAWNRICHTPFVTYSIFFVHHEFALELCAKSYTHIEL